MKAGVVGASGYLGAELLRLLAAHPILEVVSIQAHSSAGFELGALYPGLAPVYGDAVLEALDPSALGGLDVVFVSLPAGASTPVVAELVDKVGCVVDLGPDLRLKDPRAYPLWYGFEHAAPGLLARAAYGLPELFRAGLEKAALIAAPGCYVTAAALCLAPLVEAGVIEPVGVVVDAASGTSGAGRGLSAATHHAAANESFSAYGLLTHRHTPEIEQATGAQVLFTPHLAPMTRGILATCYATAVSPTTTGELTELLSSTYAAEPFVAVSPEPPGTREVYGSNLARLCARYDDRTGHVVVIAAIDNLTKGGAGQALQAANVALGLDEAAGLPRVALTP